MKVALLKYQLGLYLLKLRKHFDYRVSIDTTPTPAPAPPPPPTNQKTLMGY